MSERGDAVIGSRAERTAATRRRMLDAAAELFVASGYTGTRVEDIAARSGVAVQTVYFTFQNKRTILKELVDVHVAGDEEPVPTLQRPWVRDVLEATDPADHLSLQAKAARDINERVAPLLLVLRAAAPADADAAALWQANQQQRLQVQQHLAQSLAGKLRRGNRWSLRTADVTYVVLSPDSYTVFVAERGWTPQQWQTWTANALRRELLEEHT
jgi:AcrR family transcriptional regulator